MVDIEKVIRDTERCINDGLCYECELDKYFFCRKQLLKQALEAMEVQQNALRKAAEYQSELQAQIIFMKSVYGDPGEVVGEIVRCKDCKYAHMTYDGDCKYCDMFTDDDGNPIERYRSGDWFCADGERRTDDA